MIFKILYFNNLNIFYNIYNFLLSQFKMYQNYSKKYNSFPYNINIYNRHDYHRMQAYLIYMYFINIHIHKPMD